MRKTSLLALCSALLLTSCAEMHITRTEVATGAVNPRAIYIRPFSVAYAKFTDYNSGEGAAIRKSLAPAEFAGILREELSKLAPAMVIKPNEYPTTGWLVEGEFDLIKSGLSGTTKSGVKLHVRITDVSGENVVAASDAKNGVTPATGIKTKTGVVIYEFDVAGSSKLSGPFGSIYAAGTGNSIPFDFRNAAERIMLVLSPDPYRYGLRTAPKRD